MKKNSILLLSLLLQMVCFTSCTKSNNPSLAPTIYYYHTPEASDEFYEYLNAKLNSDSVYTKYHDKAIVVDIELTDSIIVNVEEIICEFNSMGRLTSKIKSQSTQISKLLLGQNIMKVNITNGNFNGFFGFVFDANKLYNIEDGAISK